jgi:hypothetical protein
MRQHECKGAVPAPIGINKATLQQSTVQQYPASYFLLKAQKHHHDNKGKPMQIQHCHRCFAATP